MSTLFTHIHLKRLYVKGHVTSASRKKLPVKGVEKFVLK